MPLPSLDKTWQFSVNNIAAAGVSAMASAQNLMFGIKQSLKAFGTLPWTCWGSNDGLGAGHFGNGDSNDRWAAATNLVWATAGSNHSWIVLTQGGLDSGGKASLCIDLANATGCYAAIVLSPHAGFGVANGGADGTAIARPTASDEIIINAAAVAWGQYNAAALHRYTVMQSTDGQCTRVFIFYNGGCQGVWIIDKSKNPQSQWTYPVFGYVCGGVAAATDPGNVSYAYLLVSTFGKFWILASCAFQFTGESLGPANNLIGQVLTIADEDSLEWSFGGMGIYGATAGHRGRKGEVFDMWWGSITRQTGDPYPATATKSFMEIGDIVVPWDGSTALITT